MTTCIDSWEFVLSIVATVLLIISETMPFDSSECGGICDAIYRRCKYNNCTNDEDID